ncbi:MAG: gluconate 2-dehydrogenase subunit 3 family protein [Blastocatellia bacterium]
MNDQAKEQLSESDLSRREMLRLTSAALIAAPLLKAEAQSLTPRFFTRDEFALLDELSEIIIPTDDHSPGARAAKVAGYIDFTLSESFTDEPRKIWRDGLKLVDALSQEMNGKPFMQASPDERIVVVTRLAKGEANPQQPEEKFFAELKGRVTYAYYTSEIGIQKELEYKGNTYLKEFVGFDAK